MIPGNSHAFAKSLQTSNSSAVGFGFRKCQGRV